MPPKYRGYSVLVQTSPISSTILFDSTFDQAMQREMSKFQQGLSALEEKRDNRIKRLCFIILKAYLRKKKHEKKDEEVVAYCQDHLQ